MPCSTYSAPQTSPRGRDAGNCANTFKKRASPEPATDKDAPSSTSVHEPSPKRPEARAPLATVRPRQVQEDTKGLARLRTPPAHRGFGECCICEGLR